MNWSEVSKNQRLQGLPETKEKVETPIRRNSWTGLTVLCIFILAALVFGLLIGYFSVVGSL